MDVLKVLILVGYSVRIPRLYDYFQRNYESKIKEKNENNSCYAKNIPVSDGFSRFSTIIKLVVLA